MAPTAPRMPRLSLMAGVALTTVLTAGCVRSEASGGDAAPGVQVANYAAAEPATTASIPPAQQVWRPSGGTASEADVAALGRAITAAKAGRTEQATVARDQIRDPVAKVVAEWAILRSNDSIGFARQAAFLSANPSFPASQRIRMRAEGALLENNADAATVRQFFAHRQPTSAKGKIALAIALVALDPPRVLFALFALYGLSGYAVYAWRRSRGRHASVVALSTDEPDEKGLHD